MSEERPPFRSEEVWDRLGIAPMQLAFGASEHLRQLVSTVEDQMNGKPHRGYDSEADLHQTLIHVGNAVRHAGEVLEQASRWLKANAQPEDTD